ncbi:MAG: hypothetical protein NT080_14175 [Spirochaetes bacterium]|nr:hypothetical protein [Spirochaetota bacterium]
MSARRYGSAVPNLFLESCLGTVPVLAAANSTIRAAAVGVGMAFVTVCVAVLVPFVSRNAAARFARTLGLVTSAAATSLYIIAFHALSPVESAFLAPFLPMLAFNSLVVLGIRRHDAPDHSCFPETAKALAFWLLAVIVFGFVREFLGNGGFPAAPSGNTAARAAFFPQYAIPFALTPAGGFMLFGLLAGAFAGFRRFFFRRYP